MNTVKKYAQRRWATHRRSHSSGAPPPLPFYKHMSSNCTSKAQLGGCSVPPPVKSHPLLSLRTSVTWRCCSVSSTPLAIYHPELAAKCQAAWPMGPGALARAGNPHPGAPFTPPAAVGRACSAWEQINIGIPEPGKEGNWKQLRPWPAL